MATTKSTMGAKINKDGKIAMDIIIATIVVIITEAIIKGSIKNASTISAKRARKESIATIIAIKPINSPTLIEPAMPVFFVKIWLRIKLSV